MIINNDQWTDNSNVSKLFSCFPSSFVVYVLLVTISILRNFYVSFYLLPLYAPFSVSLYCFRSRCFIVLFFF